MPWTAPALRAAMLAALLTTAPAAAATPAEWTTDDVLGVRTLSNPRVSPDGEQVAFVVRALTADSSAYDTELWLANTRTGEPRALTASSGADDTPRWSPDGATLAFLSSRPHPGVSGAARQVWTMRLDGGEAECVTHAEGAIGAFEWSRDGRFIAYLSAASESPARRLAIARREDAHAPADEWSWQQLWWFDIAASRATRLADAGRQPTGFSIAPDGRRIVLASQPTPRAQDVAASDLYLVPTSGGAARPLLQRPGEDRDPAWSPDGRWIAFVSHDGRADRKLANRRLCVVTPEGRSLTNLTPAFDEHVGASIEGPAAAPSWSSNSERLRFGALSRTQQHVFEVPLDRGEGPRPITRGVGVFFAPSWSANDSVVAFLREDSEHPAELWIKRPGGIEPRLLTDMNPQVRARVALRKQVVSWKAADGLSIEGLLIAPVQETPGRRPPLFVCLDGGDAGVQAHTFTAGSHLWPFARLAQQGWAILLPNPRGSGGHGERYRSLGAGGEAVFADIEAGIDQLAGLGLVDSTRLAIGGWFLGGFQAATALTRTTRFRAAVIGSGVTDLASFVSTSEEAGLARGLIGAWPWEDPATTLDRSPLLHARAVHTPTLFVHGEADERVPVSQSRAFHTALEWLGVSTELALLPRQPHRPVEPRLQRMTQERILAWLTRWTMPPAQTPKRPRR